MVVSISIASFTRLVDQLPALLIGCWHPPSHHPLCAAQQTRAPQPQVSPRMHATTHLVCPNGACLAVANGSVLSYSCRFRSFGHIPKPMPRTSGVRRCPQCGNCALLSWPQRRRRPTKTNRKFDATATLASNFGKGSAIYRSSLGRVGPCNEWRAWFTKSVGTGPV